MQKQFWNEYRVKIDLSLEALQRGESDDREEEFEEAKRVLDMAL